MMLELQHQDDSGEKAIRSAVHGVIGGLLGVVAIGVWAVNFDSVLHGDSEGGVFVFLGRLLLCEAIPLATLGAFHAGIGANDPTEHTLRRLLGRIVYFCGGFAFQRRTDEVAS